MRRLFSFIIILAVGVAAGTAASFWYSPTLQPTAAASVERSAAPAKSDRKILYYRNPMGAPDTSPVPKKDSMGMDYIPVYADEKDDGYGRQPQVEQQLVHLLVGRLAVVARDGDLDI